MSRRIVTYNQLSDLPGFGYVFVSPLAPTQEQIDQITATLGISADQIVWAETVAGDGSTFTLRSGVSLTEGGRITLTSMGGTFIIQSGNSLTDGRIITLNDASVLEFILLVGTSETTGAIVALGLEGGTFAISSGVSVTEGGVLVLSEEVGGEPLLATDNFNRADGALGAGWDVVQGSFAIENNQAKSTAAVSTALRTDTFADDQFVQVKLTSNNLIQIRARASAIFPGKIESYAFQSLYNTYFDEELEEQIEERLLSGTETRVNRGSEEVYGTTYFSALSVPVTHIYMRLEAVGTSIVYKTSSDGTNWTTRHTATGTNITTGKPGLFGVLNATVDDFAAGDL